MFCKNCGTQIADNAQFCPNCGTAQDIKPVNIQQPNSKEYKKPRKINKKIIAVIAALMVVVSVVSFVVVPLIDGILHPAKNSFITYVKDDELYINYSDDFSPQQLTKKYVLNSYYYFDSDEYACSNMEYYPEIKRIFFPDRVEDVDSDYSAIGMSLYYADLKKKDEPIEPVKVDSLITDYVISDDGNKVYYLNANGGLYSSDLQTNTKLAENVSSFFVDKDNNRISYFIHHSDTEKSDLYTIVPGESAHKVAEDIDSEEYSSEDGNVICFISGNKLYVTVNGNSPKEITSCEEGEWIRDCYADNAGNVVYSRYIDIYTKDYIDDDLLAADNKIEYPDWTDEDYDAKRDKYYEKKARDDIRTDLDDDALLRCYDLYYYDGSKSEKIAQHIDNIWEIDDGFVYFDSYTVNDIGRIKFSEVYNSVSDKSIYGFREYIKSKVLGNSIKSNVLINKTVNEIDEQRTLDNASGYLGYISKLNNDKTELYYMTEDTELTGTVYKVAVNGDKLGQATKLYSDVCSFCINESGQLITYRDPIKTGTDEYYSNDLYSADLYIDDKKIDTDVTVGTAYLIGPSTRNYSMLTDDGTLFYMTSCTENRVYTLKQYDGKTSTTVASDVIGFYPVGKDMVYYITSYNDDSGDLYFWNGKETAFIDSGVSSVFKTYEPTDE